MHKKVKDTQTCVIKRNLKFQDYKNCLEVAQIEDKINHLEKSKINVDTFNEDHKEFIRNNKLIWKTQQRFRSEKRNVYTEEINKMALRPNDDKRIQSIDSIEIYAHGTSEDLVWKKGETKCKNVVKPYKNV